MSKRERDLNTLKVNVEGSQVRELQENLPPSLPQIYLQGSFLWCNGAKWDLSERPVTLKVVQFFVANMTKAIHRRDLLSFLYGEEILQFRSKRYFRSKHQNLNRMLSRIRKQFENHFASVVPGGMYWMYYCVRTDLWYFYRLPATSPRGYFHI